jgi:probable phosphoglycerate mutase
MQGWSNSPLTQQGEDDAVMAAGKLKRVWFSHAFCSDTTRAERTAEIILKQLNQFGVSPLTSDRHFCEQFYGYFEGQDMGLTWAAAGGPHGAPTYADIVEKFGIGATRDFIKEADPFHDAESDAEYWARVEGAFDLIKGTTAIENDDNVLVISHGNTILSLMARFAKGKYDLSIRPKNGSITRIDFNTEKETLDEALTVIEYDK